MFTLLSEVDLPNRDSLKAGDPVDQDLGERYAEPTRTAPGVSDSVRKPMDERTSPTGEPHRDPIESEPWKLDEWSRQLGIPEQEVRQLAAQVGPVFENIQKALDEREKRRIARDEIKKTERDGL